MDIVFAITGDIRYNSRGLKQLRVLSELGVRVSVVGLGDRVLEEQLDEGVVFHMLRRPAGGGPVFFQKCHRLFKSFARQQRADIFHASDLYNLPAMAQVAKKQGGKLVYDARECYPYVAATVGRPWVRWFWGAVEGYYVKQADAVFTVSDSIASHIASAYNVERPEVLFNVPEATAEKANDKLRKELQIEENLVIVLHQGKMQKDRGCILLAQAMQYVKGAVLVFLGDGAIKTDIESEVTRLGITDRVLFRNAALPSELPVYTNSADIGVTLLEDTCLNHRYALPNKLFEYLMAGLPVLASDLPEMGQLVQKFNVGCTVYPKHPEEIARVLQGMVDEPVKRAQWSAAIPSVFETFNWENASQVFRRKYNSIINTLSN